MGNEQRERSKNGYFVLSFQVNGIERSLLAACVCVCDHKQWPASVITHWRTHTHTQSYYIHAVFSSKWWKMENKLSTTTNYWYRFIESFIKVVILTCMYACARAHSIQTHMLLNIYILYTYNKNKENRSDRRKGRECNNNKWMIQCSKRKQSISRSPSRSVCVCIFFMFYYENRME